MLRIGNYKKTKEALQAYIDGKDFAKPFVIAGWSGTGKTQMVNEIVKENNLKDLKVVDIHIPAPDDEAIGEAIDAIMVEHTAATVFLITIPTDIDPIRDLVQRGIDVSYLELDTNEWLEWAKSINPETGRVNVFSKYTTMLAENPHLISSNLTEQTEWKQELVELKQKCLSYEGTNPHELKEMLSRIIHLEHQLFLCQSDIIEEGKTDEITNKIDAILPSLDGWDEDDDKTEQIIFDLSEELFKREQLFEFEYFSKVEDGIYEFSEEAEDAWMQAIFRRSLGFSDL